MTEFDQFAQTPWIQFEITSGRILQIGMVPARDVQNQIGDGKEVLIGSATFDDYVVDGVIVPRPTPVIDKAVIAADDMDAATISNLPPVALVRIDGIEHIVEGGELQITSGMPASYRVDVPEQFPWRQFSVEIVAA